MTAALATADADADAQAKALLGEAVRLADAALERWLPPGDAAPARLHQAMRYSVFAGGKRLRPALVRAAASRTTSTRRASRSTPRRRPAPGSSASTAARPRR